MDHAPAGFWPSRSTSYNSFHGQVCKLSCQDQASSRAVQQAFEVAPLLVAELRGQVRAIIECPHGNFVVAQAIRVLPATETDFIVQEFSMGARWLMRHKFGCRVFQAIMENNSSSPIPELLELIQMALEWWPTLSQHKYGNYVMQSLVEHGLPSHKRKVSEILMYDKNLISAATNEFAANVVQKALEHCSNEDKHALADSLLSTERNVHLLLESAAGNNVLKALMRSETHALQTSNLLSSANAEWQQGEWLAGAFAPIDVDALPWAGAAEMVARLRLGDQERLEAFESLQHKLLDLASTNGTWSLAVQQMIKLHSQSHAAECVAILASELSGRVCLALKSPHANFFVQAALEAFPDQISGLVSAEALSDLRSVCTNRYGYKAILTLIRVQRLVTQYQGTFLQLLEGILGCSMDISCDEFGQWVIQEIIKSGPPVYQHKLAICLGTIDGFKRLCADAYGHHVARAIMTRTYQANGKGRNDNKDKGKGNYKGKGKGKGNDRKGRGKGEPLALLSSIYEEMKPRNRM